MSKPNESYSQNFRDIKRKSVFSSPDVKLEINDLLDGQAYVRVKNVSPSEVPEGWTPEMLAVIGARTSLGLDLRTPQEDAKLLEYLTENYHTSPLEFCSVMFELKVPKFVAIQILRHRTAHVNELSQRYTKVEKEYYSPVYEGGKGIRFNGTTSRQSSKVGSKEQTVDALEVFKEMETHVEKLYDLYNKLIDEHNVGKEVARCFLPIGAYTTLNISFDLNNLMKFFTLRCAPDAQEETRLIAFAMLELSKQFFPTVLGVWEKKQNAFSISEEELKGLINGECPSSITSKSGKEQFNSKLKLFTNLNEKNLHTQIQQKFGITLDNKTNITSMFEQVKKQFSKKDILPLKKASEDSDDEEKIKIYTEMEKKKQPKMISSSVDSDDEVEEIQPKKKVETQHVESEEKFVKVQTKKGEDLKSSPKKKVVKAEVKKDDEEKKVVKAEVKKDDEEKKVVKAEVKKDDEEKKVVKAEVKKDDEEKKAQPSKDDSSDDEELPSKKKVEEKKVVKSEAKKDDSSDDEELPPKKKVEEKKVVKPEPKKDDSSDDEELPPKKKVEEKKIVKSKVEEKKKDDSDEEEEPKPRKKISSPIKKIVSPIKKIVSPIKKSVFVVDNQNKEVINLETKLSPRPSDKNISLKKPIKVSAASPTKNTMSNRNPSKKVESDDELE